MTTATTTNDSSDNTDTNKNNKNNINDRQSDNIKNDNDNVHDNNTSTNDNNELNNNNINTDEYGIIDQIIGNHIERLIDHERWDDVYIEFTNNPEQTKRVVDIANRRISWTYLHWLCNIPNTPDNLVELVSSLYPNAIIMPDTQYGDTPLHIICRSSQMNSNKIRIILQYCPKMNNNNNINTNTNTNNINECSVVINSHHHQQQQQHGEEQVEHDNNNNNNTTTPTLLLLSDVLIRNVFGGTALHSACNHNAILDTLYVLVNANPNILKIRTREGVHVISALWNAYINTIPGTMTIARILNENNIKNTVTEIDDTTTAANNHLSLDDDSYMKFQRFWKKVEFLATELYFLTQQQQHEGNIEEDTTGNMNNRNMYVLHGLIRSGVPINMYKVALKVNPNYARIIDINTGNYPLHIILNNRPYRLKEKDAIISTINAASNIVNITNNEYDTPLLIAIRNKIPYNNGIDIIINDAIDTICIKDYNTNLYPYQYAAIQGGKVAIETTYQLLCKRPDLLSI